MGRTLRNDSIPTMEFDYSTIGMNTFCTRNVFARHINAVWEEMGGDILTINILPVIVNISWHIDNIMYRFMYLKRYGTICYSEKAIKPYVLFN